MGDRVHLTTVLPNTAMRVCVRAWQLTRLLFVYYSVRVLRAVCSVSVILRLGNLPRLNDATASRHSVGLSLYIHDSAHWPVV